MKALVSAIALSAALVTAAHASPLTGADLRKAVAGKVVIIHAEGRAIPIRYSSNGTMSGKVNGLAAALAGQGSDSGRWWISGNQLCQKWSKWMDAKSYCYRLSGKGTRVTWHRNDGRTGVAQLGG